MFKMFSSAILTVIMASNLSGAELKTAKNRIQSGPTDFYLNFGCFSVRNQKQQILSIYPHFTTAGKDKWYSLVSRKVSSKLLSMENNCWKFESSIPLNAAAEILKVAATVTVTPTNTIESEVSWEKPANAADLKESACFFGLPLKKTRARAATSAMSTASAGARARSGWSTATACRGRCLTASTSR